MLLGISRPVVPFRVIVVRFWAKTASWQLRHSTSHFPYYYLSILPHWLAFFLLVTVQILQWSYYAGLIAPIVPSRKLPFTWGSSSPWRCRDVIKERGPHCGLISYPDIAPKWIAVLPHVRDVCWGSGFISSSWGSAYWLNPVGRDRGRPCWVFSICLSQEISPHYRPGSIPLYGIIIVRWGCSCVLWLIAILSFSITTPVPAYYLLGYQVITIIF